jgi:hypothetical protein
MPLSSAPGPVDIALQAVLKGQPSGKYDYAFSSAFVGFFQAAGDYAGSFTSTNGHVPLVNSISSPFGSGWGLASLEQIFENPAPYYC